jgi:lipopolysaccharide export system protein LptC
VTGFQATMHERVGAPVSAQRLRAFARARRHSRWVRFAKWAIPLGALVGMAALAVVIVFDPFRTILPGLTVGPITVSGTQVTMERPKLSGFRNDLRPYQVTASAATQDVRQPSLVALKDLRANLATDDQGGTARLEARTGTLDTQKEQMKLEQDVHVRTDAGQAVDLRSAFVDFKAGTVVSTEPVSVSLGSGVIEAKGMRVSDNGRIIRFRGRVQAVFRTSQFGPAAAPGAAAPGAPGPGSPGPGSPGPGSPGPGSPAAPPSAKAPQPVSQRP